MRTILAFQVFAVVIALGGGDDRDRVLANETYRQYFELRDNNVASAYALFILLLSTGQCRRSISARSRTHAEVRSA